MKQESILRQQAIGMFLSGQEVSVISSTLNRSRQWVYKWIARYKANPGGKWYLNQSTAPHNSPGQIDSSLKKSIISIRKNLQDQPYAQKGAISIMYELKRLNLPPPSLSTINRVISQNRMIHPSSQKNRKQTEYPNYFSNVQQMDLIGPKYLKGGSRLYLFNIIDVATHFVGVYPIPDKAALSITHCVIDYWKTFQMPDFLQMDNELSFRGSNRFPRGLGLLMRFALSNGVSPIFIPPAEPWRNGL